MCAFMNAASDGFVRKPETNVPHVPGRGRPGSSPDISRKCSSRIFASGCSLPPRAQPIESNQKSFADWIACGLRCSNFRLVAHSESVWERYFFVSVVPLPAIDSLRDTGYQPVQSARHGLVARVTR